VGRRFIEPTLRRLDQEFRETLLGFSQGATEGQPVSVFQQSHRQPDHQFIDVFDPQAPGGKLLVPAACGKSDQESLHVFLHCQASSKLTKFVAA
jgi:hypothetical protein